MTQYEDVDVKCPFYVNSEGEENTMRIPNRSIMYKRYLDGEITETEHKTYLAEQEERERLASERFEKTLERIGVMK